MRTLYLDCSMGAAGDMLTAALLELMPDPDAALDRLNRLGIPGVVFSRETSVKCGISGTHISVTADGVSEDEHIHDHHSHAHDDHQHSHDHVHSHEHEHIHAHTHAHEHGHEHHSHRGLHEIEHMISALDIPQKVKADASAVYALIAEAESRVHGVPVSDIHFHEVGTMDAVADVTAVCLLLDELSPDEIVVSPVHVGSGHVRCAHGLLPVPAPATAYILRDVPIYGGRIDGELCTPTGAALLKHFASRFGDIPVMRTGAVGYGMGKKDFPMANCVRAMLGETADRTDVVLELSCNVDDMTAEDIGFAMESLFDGGAREVYTVPIGMKKSRPGTLIRVMCTERDRDKMLELIFKYTTTIGVRESVTRRYVLDRDISAEDTPLGEIHSKISTGYGVRRVKYEYEDLARAAREHGLSLDEVRRRLAEE